jgi:hypothetical protein
VIARLHPADGRVAWEVDLELEGCGEDPHALALDATGSVLAAGSGSRRVAGICAVGLSIVRKLDGATGELISECADADRDAVCDASDNCDHAENPDQADDGGVGTAAADGIGNACQCGDVSGNGRVNLVDVALFNAALGAGGETGGVWSAKCDVGGSAGCTLADVGRLNLGLAGVESAVRQACVAAGP